MRISDWSSDVCSSDLRHNARRPKRKRPEQVRPLFVHSLVGGSAAVDRRAPAAPDIDSDEEEQPHHVDEMPVPGGGFEAEMLARGEIARSEEHTSELQSLMRISYAVFCLQKKRNNKSNTRTTSINQI